MRQALGQASSEPPVPKYQLANRHEELLQTERQKVTSQNAQLQFAEDTSHLAPQPLPVVEPKAFDLNSETSAQGPQQHEAWPQGSQQAGPGIAQARSSAPAESMAILHRLNVLLQPELQAQQQVDAAAQAARLSVVLARRCMQTAVQLGVDRDILVKFTWPDGTPSGALREVEETAVMELRQRGHSDVAAGKGCITMQSCAPASRMEEARADILDAITKMAPALYGRAVVHVQQGLHYATLPPGGERFTSGLDRLSPSPFLAVCACLHGYEGPLVIRELVHDCASMLRAGVEVSGMQPPAGEQSALSDWKPVREQLQITDIRAVEHPGTCRN